MRLRYLTTFVKVAQLGSFHAAANQLHATQPTISARIQALENELNVKLFQRDKSGTRLTARGMQLLPYAEKLLAISQEMKAQLKTDAPERGSLRIGIADTLAHLWLTELMQAWRTQYPLMSFEMTSDVTHVLTQQLQNHQLDLAFMVMPTQPVHDLVLEPLCRYEQVWVAAPSQWDESQTYDLSDLAQFPILSFPRDTRPWHHLHKLFSPLKRDVVIHTCSSVASLLSLIEQGLGIALLPKPLVIQSLENRTMVEINVKQNLVIPSLDFCCSWRLDDDRMLPKLFADHGRKKIMEDFYR